ncbi:MAG TPA: glycoside hydrolase family 130 protein [Candidatus Sulfotelmatobacter sp.]|nr:glycoside hydrolase family 130 protein [Candidatus Sulfotelmatobacter sp.]
MNNKNEYRQIGSLKSDPIISRYPGNPVLSAKDVPYPSMLAYNAGVVKYNCEYVMVFRNDYGYDETIKKAPHFQLGLGRSDDGIHWKIDPKPILEGDNEEVLGSYDPRLIWMNGRFFITYTQYTKHGYRATICVTDDFKSFEFLDRSLPDNRDMVLFPKKIDGQYLRLDRPFPYFSRDKKVNFDIWISESPDMVYWGKSELLLCSEDVPFANERIGAGSPPVYTKEGWLVLFHAVDVDPERGKNGWEDQWNSRYTMGALLLDLKDPHKVIGSSKTPLLVPEAEYEVTNGFRNNVIFPTALVPEENGLAKIYYGAADTVLALAFAKTSDLIQHCLNGR